MSATNGKPGELTAISKAKDLVNHTMWASNKVFPKSVRFTLSQRMETAALDVLECLIEANEIFPRSAAETAERLDLQKRALTKCKLLLNLLDIALERGYIDIRRCEDWTKKILDVKNLTASWRKKDAARFSPKGCRRFIGVFLVRHRLLLCVVRSPNASNSNNVRNVSSDGTLNNNNAYNGNNGVRPASVEFTATK